MRFKILFFIIGFVFSFLLFTSIRFLTFQEPAHTHYHANFAMYVDGNRVVFTDPKYSEEISACSVHGLVDPKQRTHLHEKNQDVIHVHADGVTWNHFFNNIGFSVGDEYLVDDKGKIYQKSDTKDVIFILNGKEISSIANRLIKSEDRLLINYGIERADQLIKDKFNEVSSSAKEFNQKNDPASCSGPTHTSFREKLKESVF